MAALSPTPLSTSYGSHPRLQARRRPSRPALRRGSPISMASHANAVSTNGVARQISVGDSSDDEIPQPMKFSALTKALLGDEPSTIEASSPPGDQAANTSATRWRDEGDSGHSNPSRPHRRRSIGRESPSFRNDGSPSAKRVVRLSAGSAASATLRRSVSTSNARISPRGSPGEMITPAPRPRTVRVSSPNNYGNSSSGGYLTRPNSSGRASEAEGEDYGGMPSTIARPRGTTSQDSALRYGSSTIGRSRYGEETGVHGSIRVKRLGKVKGAFLSGPARRGRRRQSEEDQSPAHEEQDQEGSSAEQIKNELAERQSVDAEPASNGSLEERRPVYEGSEHASFAPEHQSDEKQYDRPTSPSSPPTRPRPLQSSKATNGVSSTAQQHPVFKVPALPPSIPSRHDQENEPPPTFKRSKPQGFGSLDKIEKVSVMADDKMLGATPATMSPERKALAPRSRNTPLRPAPPPPKMTVLDTATTTAGAAATSHSRKKRNHISVNGKAFTRLDCIGRGGSSRVYRVMAENYKIFALKKVTLEEVDELTIRGYKGEIELLKKLESVDRVIDLYDYEINDDKQTLSVLMEMGESDLDRILRFRLNADNATFDINFTRYYWKEMLECIAAVHSHSIVHSDLKPANFLLVKGRLKLIDFGIANAIQDDTVNVHREQQVGTPNYMSPEAIVDSNAKKGLASSASEGRMMKLGKPSDIWSLGCILYQMVYGKPPFAHLSNQFQKIMAIPNPNHAIAFPNTTTIGDVFVPASLIRTLKKCLNRDPSQRPTVEQLLDEKDGFLYPDLEGQGYLPVSQEVLGRILANVVGHCERVGVPGAKEMEGWPGGFFERIRAALREEGRA
ncbi:MAG: hypothetical protein M1819_004609 [Sarea resinae]|nr:MAG: hypothetical protein M1819_004609 [Sarea resinae]